MKKLTLILDETNWLEATWVEEITIKVEGKEDSINTKQLHCESYSGHPEHIAMLRAKALEFGTDLTEFETLIKQAEDAFVIPTQEELDKELTEQRIQEYKAYLARTDYIVTKIAEAQALGEDIAILLSKYAVELQQRKEARAFIGANL